jgi:hypothetical protein
LRREDYKTFLVSNNWPNDSGTIGSNWTLSHLLGTSGSYLSSNALKRIKFTYDYSLCKSTPNSFDTNKGKLTLKRLSIMGRNGVQVVPDYKFDYGTNNPNYDLNKWDAWGMYNSSGTNGSTTHAASSLETDGAAWSLSQITTPQGSTISVNYERDTYSSVSGLDNIGQQFTFSYSANLDPTLGVNTMNITNVSGLNANDILRFANGSYASITCSNGSPYNVPISGDVVVQGINGTSVVVSPKYGQLSGPCLLPGGAAMSVTYQGTVNKVKVPIFGDRLRVASIVLSDQGQNHKARYLYKNNDGTSSGVIAQEPQYAKKQSYDFDRLPGYPNTPVMYSTVSVLTGSLSSDADFVSKQVYQFETPSKSLIIINNDSILFRGKPAGTNDANDYIIKREIVNNTSKLGALKSIGTYDNIGNLVSLTSMLYSQNLLNANGVNNYQGYFSQGTLMHDGIKDASNNFVYKMTRTTVIKNPNTVQRITTTNDGFTTQSDNLAWDFISGQVVEKNNMSVLGLKTKTVIQPAYTISAYSGMGPRALNSLNSNMLSQTAAEYTFRLDAFGSISGLITGQATTWSNSWNNYREYNQPTGVYVEGVGSTPSSIWRKDKTYIYKGANGDLNTDGSLSFNSSVNTFDFSSTATNPKWQQTGASTRYDHYSLPVETYDPIANIYAGVKRDFNDKFVFASASNASYHEFAYSGAEDANASGYFGGEIALNSPGSTSAIVVSGTPGVDSHTGQNAVQVVTGANAFVYKPVVLSPNRVYRAQVWTNSLNGAIYYRINGNTAINAVPVAANKAGNWYKVVVDIPMPSSFSSFEVGVTSTNGIVNFDDFKFQPRDAVVTANVYDTSTGYLTYTLGNDNLYIRYQYDNSGILLKTFAESIKYNGERLISEKKYDYKRFHTNQ